MPRLKHTLRGQKNIIILAAIAIFILVILVILMSDLSKKEYIFEEGFNELGLLDEKYGASFKTEKLNVSMVDYNKIEPMLDDLEEYRKKIEKSRDSKDKEALLLFLTVRENMLRSERYFYLGQKIGNIGFVTDPDGFRCSESKYMIDVAYYYNKSWSHGIQAQSKLDDLLYWYRDINNLRDLVGVNENKTRFYKSPLDHVKDVVNNNLKALKQFCKMTVFLNPPEGDIDEEKQKAL